MKCVYVDLFIVFPYEMYRVLANICFISDIDHLDLLSCFWPVLQKTYQFFWSFWRTSPFFIDFLFIVFLFSTLLISVLYDFFPPAYFGLFCFYFSRCLRWKLPDSSPGPCDTSCFVLLTFVMWSTGCWMVSCGQRRTTGKLK